MVQRGSHHNCALAALLNAFSVILPPVWCIIHVLDGVEFIRSSKFVTRSHSVIDCFW